MKIVRLKIKRGTSDIIGLLGYSGYFTRGTIRYVSQEKDEIEIEVPDDCIVPIEGKRKQEYL